MLITLHSNAIFIEVPSNSIDAIIMRHFIKKHFIDTVKTIHSISILNQRDDQLTSRKIFLHWLYSNYRKDCSTSSLILIDELFQAMHLPIKIIFVGKPKRQDLITVKMTIIGKEHVKITFSPHKTALFNALISKYFKSHEILFYQNPHYCIIAIPGISQKRRLLQLLQRKQILDHQLNVIYDLCALKKFIMSPKKYVSLAKEQHLLDAYKLFDSTPVDTIEMIKQRYKRLLSHYHPDRVYNQSPSVIHNYTKKFQAITEAFESIKTDKKSSFRSVS